MYFLFVAGKLFKPLVVRRPLFWDLHELSFLQILYSLILSACTSPIVYINAEFHFYIPGKF